MTSSSIEKISKFDLVYYRRRQQNHVYDAVLSRFAELANNGGITRKDIALTLDKNPAQITRWLKGSSNLNLDTISDLLLAMGAEMKYEVVDLENNKAFDVSPLNSPTSTNSRSNSSVETTLSYSNQEASSCAE